MSIVDPVLATHPRCWLSVKEPDNRKKIRAGSRCRTDGSGGGNFTLENLTAKEYDALESFLCGQSYVRVIDGRLHAYSAYEELPQPEADPIIGRHWRRDGTVKEFGGIPSTEGWHSPGIVLTGLGAGITDHVFGGAEAAHRRNQAKVEECGFVCLRSPRSEDGKYWEQWVIHSLTFAKGPLKKHMDQFTGDRKLDWKRTVEEACRFLTCDLGINYGSLDITIQRWALTYD